MPETEPDTEARILDAARRVFERRGVAAARTQEIADEAGVNKALLHYYFRSKEKLADAVFVRAAGALFAHILATLLSNRPLRDKVQAVVTAQTEAAAANPYLPGFILCELRADPTRLTRLLGETMPVETVRAQMLRALQADLDAEYAAGRLRRVEADVFLVSLVSQLVFPVAGAHMLDAVLGLDAAARERLAHWRMHKLADAHLRSFAP